MLVTITNLSSTLALNTQDTNEGGSGAVGGAVKNPLPYPWPGVTEDGNTVKTVTSLAASGTKQIAWHPADWHYRRVPWITLDPRDQWNQLVFAGTVSLTVAAETARRDSEELFINAV